MKVKPKEVLVNLPVALLFDEPWEIASFAANINTILHGKVRLKAEELGTLGGRYVGLFYLQRNAESQQIHDEFMRLIEEEQITEHDHSYVPNSTIPPLEKDAHPRHEDLYAHALCTDSSHCGDEMLHLKGEDHCRCGDEWHKGKCVALTGDIICDHCGESKDECQC